MAMRIGAVFASSLFVLWCGTARASHPCFEDAGPCDCCHGRFDCPPECFPDASGGDAGGGRGGSAGRGGNAGSGARAGSGGISSGGSGGSSGSGSGGSSGSGAGGTSGGGSSGGGAGGASGGAAGTGASGAAGGAGGSAEDDGGCSCSLPGQVSRGAGTALGVLFGAFALRRRRRLERE
jgi:MYXO-CTERM domain-containing protein